MSFFVIADDMENYYKVEFQNILKRNSSKEKQKKQPMETDTLTFDQLLQWSDLKQVMADFQLSRDEILQLYISSAASTAATGSSRGFDSKRRIQVTESEFVQFNHKLEAYLLQMVPAAPVDWDTVDP